MVKVTAAMVNSPGAMVKRREQRSRCRVPALSDVSPDFASHEESIPTHSGDSWNSSMDPATSSCIQGRSFLNSTTAAFLSTILLNSSCK